MSTPAGPKYAPPPTIATPGLMTQVPQKSNPPVKTNVQPATAASTVTKTDSFNPLTPTPTQIGGAGSSGTMNPNYDAQTSAFGNAPQQNVRGLFPSVASSLASFDPFANPTVSGAYQKAQELNKALAESKRNEAEGTATLLRQPIPLGDQEGQARVLQDQYLKQQSALADEFAGQASLYGAGFTGTQQQLSGLQNIAGLSPEATRYEAFGGASLSPQNRANELAQQVKSGLISPQAAEAQMNSLYGGAGATFLNQALQGGGFNYNTATAQSAAQQSNVQQQGTAQVDIARQGLADATQNYVNMTAAADYAKSQSNAISTILDKTGLNNVSSADFNKVLNNLQGRFSGTDFAALNTALRDARLAYSNLLSSGGTTPTTNDANSIASLDINQSAAAIKASIEQLDASIARRLQSQYGAMQTFQTQLQGGGQQQYSQPSGSQTGPIDWGSLAD